MNGRLKDNILKKKIKTIEKIKLPINLHNLIGSSFHFQFNKIQALFQVYIYVYECAIKQMKSRFNELLII